MWWLDVHVILSPFTPSYEKSYSRIISLLCSNIMTYGAFDLNLDHPITGSFQHILISLTEATMSVKVVGSNTQWSLVCNIVYVVVLALNLWQFNPTRKTVGFWSPLLKYDHQAKDFFVFCFVVVQFSSGFSHNFFSSGWKVAKQEQNIQKAETFFIYLYLGTNTVTRSLNTFLLNTKWHLVNCIFFLKLSSLVFISSKYRHWFIRTLSKFNLPVILFISSLV